ncbi:MAG: hypothetical protein Q4B17_01320 [Lautropia sp.]|nr:hypothetical protein [Lautropia sp.]
MNKRVLIFDTSVLCCWLKVPGKETAGTAADQWTTERIERLVEDEKKKGSTFVLPIASLIETGNHIAQSAGRRHECVHALAEHLMDSADNKSPWAAFTDQSALWEPEQLRALANTWPALAVGGTSIGDATIKDVAEHYAKAGFHVEILTGDAGLKAYEPRQPVMQPRRRSVR